MVKRKILKIVSVVFVVVIVVLGIITTIYLININKTENEFDTLEEQLTENTDDDNGFTKADDGTLVNTRLLALYEENSDIIGWITIEDTVISYPVMWTPNNPQYYLHMGFDKTYSSAGCLFVDGSCTPIGENVSDNVIIYGHNMAAGTMFHSLISYEDEDYYNEHKIINFDTLDGCYEYEVIAAFRTKINNPDYNFYEFISGSEEEFNEFIENAQSLTPYFTTGGAEYGDKLIMLSTCAYHTSGGRYVVVAKRL